MWNIFLDSCASLNAITRSTLNKIKKLTNLLLGPSRKQFFLQAYSNSTISSEVVELKISIRCKNVRWIFQGLLKKMIIFDVLNRLSILFKKNRFDINLVKR